MNREDVTEAVMSVSPFNLCSKADIGISKKLFYKGDTVSDSLDGVPCVGIICEGEVNVYTSLCDERAVSVLKSGDMFGICNIFASRPMPTALMCAKKATVAYVTKENFALLMGKYPEFAVEYARICNEKIMFLAQRLDFASIPSAAEKVRTYISRRAAEKEIEIPSKEMLSRLLGISRASLFRQLAKLRDEGYITEDENKIYIIKEIEK